MPLGGRDILTPMMTSLPFDYGRDERLSHDMRDEHDEAAGSFFIYQAPSMIALDGLMLYAAKALLAICR